MFLWVVLVLCGGGLVFEDLLEAVDVVVKDYKTSTVHGITVAR